MNSQDELASMLRQSAEDFVGGNHDAAHLKGRIGALRRIDRGAWSKMAGLGWLGLALPESLGGSGMGPAEAAVLAEVFGRTLYPEPLLAAALMPAMVLAASDGHPAQATLAAQLAAGERLTAVAWQESAGQLDAAVAPSTRWNQGKLWGAKQFVCAVEDDSLLLVSAAAPQGTTVWAVDAGATGVAREPCATAQGNYSTVTLDGVKPLFDQPLCSGETACNALTQAVTAARLGAAAQLAGVARGCLARTIAHVAQRTQFGRPIGSFQTVSHRCVDLHIGVSMADASWRHAASLARSDPSRGAAVDAAKARAGDVALEVGRTSVQLHGAMGFTEEADIGLFLRAAMQYASWLGGSRALRRRFLDWQLSTPGAGHSQAACEVAHG